MKGGNVLRSYPLSDVHSYFMSGDPEDRPHSLLARAWPFREELLQLTELLMSYDSTLWTKRIEHTYIDLYTNDQDFYNMVSEKFESFVARRFEPDEATADLLEQPQIIVAAKLPHNKYRFKVYLKPHKLAGDKEGKKKYIDWIKSQSPRITCTPAVEKWFIKTDWNWDRRYVLVEDENTLLMLKLRNSEVAGRVYNYVITDK